jgi:uncharacterized protein
VWCVAGMVVGVCTVELWIPESQSLKDKRQVLHSVKDRLRGKFNLSIAEVDGQDLWQKAVLGMACVANDGSHVEQVLEQALNVIKSMPTIEVVRVHRELL